MSKYVQCVDNILLLPGWNKQDPTAQVNSLISAILKA